MSHHATTLELASGVRLILKSFSTGKASAFLFLGGRMLCATTLADSIRIDQTYPTGLWLDNSWYDLPGCLLADVAGFFNSDDGHIESGPAK